jgi:hypothetical protein
MEIFDGLEYTREAILEELALIERHARDGSAVNAGCGCIEEKHLLTLAGLASEGVTLAKSDSERKYYMNLADLARSKRQEILNADWETNNKESKCEEKIEKCLVSGHSLEDCRRKTKCDIQ